MWLNHGRKHLGSVASKKAKESLPYQRKLHFHSANAVTRILYFPFYAALCFDKLGCNSKPTDPGVKAMKFNRTFSVDMVRIVLLVSSLAKITK